MLEDLGAGTVTSARSPLAMWIAAVATDRRLIDHWRERGNVQKEGEAYLGLASRLVLNRKLTIYRLDHERLHGRKLHLRSKRQ
jgi:hypothetical protein